MKLNHIALSIEYPKDITDFYGIILGMEEERNFILNRELAERIFDIKRDTRVCLLKNKNLILEIFISPEKKERCFHHICISVQNREETVYKAINSEYKVTRIERDRSDLIFIRDKSGNIFEIKDDIK